MALVMQIQINVATTYFWGLPTAASEAVVDDDPWRETGENGQDLH
jgi:hypothetical protein